MNARPLDVIALAVKFARDGYSLEFSATNVEDGVHQWHMVWRKPERKVDMTIGGYPS